MAVTDIRIQTSLPRNLKIRRLRTALGPGACWALQMVWLYAAENAPSGEFPGWSDEDLEAAADWDGQPGSLVAELVRLRLVERLPDGGVAIHDWEDNQPWVANADARSEAARLAAERRWHHGQKTDKAGKTAGNGTGKATADADRMPPACPPHADRNAVSEKGNADFKKGNAPSPSPSPSPNQECVSEKVSLPAREAEPPVAVTHTHDVSHSPEPLPTAEVEIVAQLYDLRRSVLPKDSRFAKMAGEPLERLIRDWRQQARGLLADDQQPAERVFAVLKWLARGSGKQALFWRPKIRDATEFRARFDQLLLARAEDMRDPKAVGVGVY